LKSLIAEIVKNSEGKKLLKFIRGATTKAVILGEASDDT